MDQKINRLGVVNMDQIEVSSISVKKGIGRYWNIKKGEKLIISFSPYFLYSSIY